MKTTNRASDMRTQSHLWNGIDRLGFWSAILTAILAASAFAVGITTQPRFGPFCLSACIPYPYTDAAAFVPRDYLWMYPGILLELVLKGYKMVGCEEDIQPI